MSSCAGFFFFFFLTAVVPRTPAKQGLFREGWAVYRKAVKPLASQLSPEFYTASMYIAAMVGRDVEYVMVEAAGAGVTPTPHMHAALVVHWLSIQNFDEAAWVRGCGRPEWANGVAWVYVGGGG